MLAFLVKTKWVGSLPSLSPMHLEQELHVLAFPQSESTTSRLHIVFDALTKTMLGVSLNNELLVRPPVDATLIDICYDIDIIKSPWQLTSVRCTGLSSSQWVSMTYTISHGERIFNILRTTGLRGWCSAFLPPHLPPIWPWGRIPLTIWSVIHKPLLSSWTPFTWMMA